MPESFQNLLSAIAQSASASATPVGADAARRRGRQRSVRQRAVACVAATVLVGGSATVALAVAAGHGGTPKPITNSGTATPDAGSAPPSPSAGPSTPGSPSAGASPGAGATGSGMIGDLNTIVPGAWTSAGAFALTPGSWTANMARPAIHTADRQWFYSCHSADTLTHLGALGYQELTYGATMGGSPVGADQVLFFFRSNGAAEQALGTVQNDYAHCPEPATGVNGVPMTGTVQQTETLDGGYAWVHTFRTAQGSPAQPADIPADNHEFFVQRGDALEMVWFGGNPTVDDSRNDLTFLADLESNLCVYGGHCPATTHPLAASINATGSTTLRLGGSAIEFTVGVTNESNDTIRNITPVVSLGRCTCVNTPLPIMPPGVLQRWDSAGGTWKTQFYDTEGSGMDFVLSPGVVQVPPFDLGPGQSVTFRYRLQLDPASSDKLPAQYHVSNGTASVGVSLVHPIANSANAQIGNASAARLPVTVVLN
ncbi:hypothetical protein KGA66_18460 [Actinocrinis puniceicyclus]|uniref:Uncharacterized protein n=1 Tax=Actinocrinis puniceicyclus TaxID=977794 RepID=A0A8J8BEB8_9ACTN|nr:hypothetical protein [Actinocrinis puniceicyclus]MBS2965046.1 hypothetical protein [Actinocrinis puniceicyclus]